MTTRKGQKMNCYKCVSKEVCFLQKQIEGLAERATDRPFFHKTDTQPDRTLKMFEARGKREERFYNMHHKLKEIIASNCPLYVDRIQK